MSQAIFVEILNPDGSLRSRQQQPLPVRLGSAYDNDIIFDDPYTAPHHAIIERNQLDELVLTDLGSLNGIKRNHKREAFFVVDGEHHYQLGRTRLRIRTQDFQPEPEVPDDINHRWEGWRPAVGGLVLLGLSTLLGTWVNDLSQKSATDYVLATVYMITFALAWSGAWALLGRLFTGQPRFGRQLFITACALVAAELWEHLSALLGYALSLEWLSTYTATPTIALVAVALYFHVHTAGHRWPRRLKLYLASLTLLSSAVVMISQYQESRHLADELYLSNLYPPSLRLSSDQPAGEFIAAMAQLQPRVDKLRNPKKDSAAKADVRQSTSSDASTPAAPAPESLSTTESLPVTERNTP